MAACGSGSLEVPSADSVSPALPDVCVQRVRVGYGSCVPFHGSCVPAKPFTTVLVAPATATAPPATAAAAAGLLHSRKRGGSVQHATR